VKKMARGRWGMAIYPGFAIEDASVDADLQDITEIESELLF
jgi:hypothetical protein